MSRRANRSRNKAIEPAGKNRSEPIVLARTSIEAYSGPLPPPDELAKYNQAYDGCARDIVEMAKLQQQSRINLETKMVDQACRASILGSIFGFVLCALVASFIFFYAISTSVWEALWAETIPFLAVLTDRIFAYATRKRDLKEKEGIKSELAPEHRDSEGNQNPVIDMQQS